MSVYKNAEEQKLVDVFAVQDINGATLSEDTVSLKGYGHLDIEISLGNIAGTTAVTVKQAQDVSETGEKALAFTYMWKNGTTAVTSNTFNLTNADDNAKVIIPIEPSMLDLANGFDCVRLDMTDPSAACLVHAEYRLTSGRYGTGVSAIVD
jgi:hypothetical protein